MGQKVNPIGFRIGFINDWDSKWFANKKNYVNFLHEDLLIRKLIFKKFLNSYISKIEIERISKKINVLIFTAKPGMIIGKGGSEIEKFRKFLKKNIKKNINLNIKEVKKIDLNAKLVSEFIAKQIEKRISFRRAQKQAIQRSMRSGAKGIKIQVSGRLNGIDIARIERSSKGTIPLHTLRAKIDYFVSEANTTYGKIGVKVWIYLGDILNKKKKV